MLTRRHFLRGVGGAALALPLLDAASSCGSAGSSGAAAAFPKRLVIVFTPNGTVGDAWTPTGGTRDFVLQEILAPLDRHRADLVVAAGIDLESSYHGPGDGAHWNGMGHLLTGTELIDLGKSVFWGGGISVDQRVAQVVGRATRFPSLELSTEDNPATVASRLSYLGPRRPVAPEPDPAKVLARVFGGPTPAQRALRRSVLDAVQADYAALAPRLGAADRHKIVDHLEALRAVERTLLAAPPASCAAPDLPRDGGPAPLDMPAVGRAQMDLLVRALACDLTRVVTLQWSNAVSMTRMPWVGVGEAHHDLSHQSLEDPEVRAKLVRINRWYAEQVAALLDRMKQVREGDGTLLDHSLVLWCNELSVGEIHARRAMPFVLAGRCGGALATGRFLRYGHAAGKPPPSHNDLLVSVCQAMDVPVTSFGNPAYCTGPLPGLLG